MQIGQDTCQECSHSRFSFQPRVCYPIPHLAGEAAVVESLPHCPGAVPAAVCVSGAAHFGLRPCVQEDDFGLVDYVGLIGGGNVTLTDRPALS